MNSGPLPSTDAHDAAPSRGGQRLRIRHLGKYYAPAFGGIEAHTRTLARRQATLGHDVAVLCIDHRRPGRGGAKKDEPEWDGPVRVHRAPRRATLARWDWTPGLRNRLRSFCADADIVHLHVPNPTMLLALAPLADRTALIVGYHSDVIRQRVLAGCLRPFERSVFRRAAAFVVSSRAYADASPTLRRLGDRVAVVPFGIDLDPFRRPAATLEAPTRALRTEWGTPTWLCVGRLVYYKGFEVALRALRHVPGRLVVIGSGPLAGRLRDVARTAGVQDRVTWWESATQEELVTAYHAATALWFPSVSRSESFGLVQVEALASGLPVLNTDLAGSGVPTVGADGETGFSVPPGDPRALAAAARRLLDDPDLHARFAVRAPVRAARLFDHDVMTRSMLDVYERALGRSPVPADPATVERTHSEVSS